jgi:demethylmenaquinone methyltransferase / 2-methoxy-6-polyprenyl-1,4-benzoquinol methylase
MSNPFYVPGQHRAERVKSLFGQIASRYDLINDLQSFGLHRVWKTRLVTLARVSPGEQALDVCCGTGDLAIALNEQGATAIGLDFTEEMLAIAASRKPKVQSSKSKASSPTLSGQNRCHLEFTQGDAIQLPFPGDTFDIVTVGYGLRNLSDWQTGLSEMRRVAKPGGRLLVLDFGKPENALWRWLYFAYLRLFVPILGKVFCGDSSAYSYILESLQHYPAQKGVADKMHELGLHQIRTINLLGGAMSIHYAEKTIK